MEYKAAEVVRTPTTSIHLFPRAFSEIILIASKLKGLTFTTESRKAVFLQSSHYLLIGRVPML